MKCFAECEVGFPMENPFSWKRHSVSSIPLSKSLVHMLWIISLFPLQNTTAISMAKPGCPDNCMNVTIPYPFGIGRGCYLDTPFEVICKGAPYLHPSQGGKAFRILEILDHVSVMDIAVAGCRDYNKSGALIGFLSYDLSRTFGSKHWFSYSHIQNKFIAMGCGVFAYITEFERTNYSGGCASLCDKTSTISSSCSGMGCCRTCIPHELRTFTLQIDTMNTENCVALTPKPCGIAFLADRDFSGYSKFNLSANLMGMKYYEVPVVLNWKIGKINCNEARSTGTYICGKNSKCDDSPAGLGYQCRCLPGHQGNPYLPSGCQVICAGDSEHENGC